MAVNRQRKILGKICASLRKDILNYSAGRPRSQADLAEETGLSERIIGQIERGEKVNLHAELLLPLFDAFHLNSEEKKRFILLASDVDPENIYDQKLCAVKAQQDAFEMLRRLYQPGLIHDGLYRIVGMNSAYWRIYGLTDEYLATIPDDDPTKYHIVRHIHDPHSPVRATFASHIEAVELSNATYWRYLSLAHRHSTLFCDVQTHLMGTYRRFNELWHQLAHGETGAEMQGLIRPFQHQHPTLKNLTYSIITKRIHKKGVELFLVTLSPYSKYTYDTFHNLIDNNSFRAIPDIVSQPIN